MLFIRIENERPGHWAVPASLAGEREAAMSNRSEHETLNGLIESCHDGERGFAFAAEHVKSAELKRLFAELSTQRARFANELLPFAQRLGGDAPHDGTRLAALHRGWMSIQEAIRHSDEAIVSQAVLGDHATVRAYADAVAGMLPPEARDVVQRQLGELESTHGKLSLLERKSPS